MATSMGDIRHFFINSAWVVLMECIPVPCAGETVHENGPVKETPTTRATGPQANPATPFRREWWEGPSPEMKEIARSTAVIFEKKDGYLEKTVDGYKLSPKTPTIGEAEKLCPGEPFYDQPNPGHCSTTLVAPDILLTAQHCLVTACADLIFVFDFLQKTKSAGPTKFDNEQVYRCKSVAAEDKEADWALIRIDREVKDRKPVAVRTEGEPSLGERMVLVGYPDGLPLKFHEPSPMRPIENADVARFLEVPLNALPGDSGAAVLNEKTLEIEGILNVGFAGFDESIDPKTGKPCFRYRPAADSQSSTPAWVSRASNFRKALKN